MMEATTAEYRSAKEKHCLSVMSSMWDLRSQNGLCDVAIVVDDKTIHCHRHVLSAASEYFRAMFAGGFEESSVPKVTLHGVDPNTFETIIQFMYTGDVVVNTSNACALIDAAQFYGLATLEAYLMEFTRRTIHTLSSEDILKMFTAARTQGLKNLFKYLGDYIYGDFGFFSDSPEFVNTSWDSLTGLSALTSEAGTPFLSDTFVEGVLKWIRGQVDASAEERGKYLEQFVRILQPTKSLTNACIRHMLEQHKNAEQVSGTNAVATLGEGPPKLLHAFIHNNEGEKSTVFTLHETKARLTWAYSGEFESGDILMKNVAIDDSLYAMIPGAKDNSRARFSLYRRAYAGAPHVSWYQRQDLKQPPCVMVNFQMCGEGNHIFMYNKSPRVEHQVYTFMQLYEPSQNNRTRHVDFIFWYKRDIDQWFSLPPPKEYRSSCITCDDRMLYLIGGTNSNAAVQGYDQRTRAWMDLPSTESVYDDAACCIRDGKVWVVGGVSNPTYVEIFDPTAGKWKRGKDLVESRSGGSQLVNWNSVKYGNTVVSFRDHSLTKDFDTILFSDDGNTSGWNMMPDMFSPWYPRSLYHNRITDMVVF